MNIAILSGSVYGTAEEVARHAAQRLGTAGHNARYLARAGLEDLLGFEPKAIVVVCSTTGLGELPDDIQPLYHALRDGLPAALRGLQGGIVALGDSAYGDTFCAGGEQIGELYSELGIEQPLEMLRLDASETVTPESDAEPWLDAFAAAVK
ncbi:flavodoxin [Pseudomonas sp. Marseille-QA0892]